MRRTCMTVAALLLAAAAAGAGEGGELKDQRARENYAFGVETGRALRGGGLVFDEESFNRGLRDGMDGGKLLLTEKELFGLRTNLQKEQIRRLKAAKLSRSERSQRSAEENRAAGERFLAENGRKEGVVTLPSGLQYRVLKEGTGKRPTESDTVEVTYRGTLIDGTEFDRSARSGKPSLLKVDRLVPGFREALTLMPEGSRWLLFLPPRLAYGEAGTGRIGPGTTILLEVELFAVR